MRVAVTGASGSIGAYVLEILRERGHELIAVGRTPPRRDDVRFTPAALEDEESLARGFAGARVVVHLAAVTSPFRAPTLDVLKTNVDGTFRVLEAAVRAGVGKVVFASSGAATGFSFPVRDRVPRYLPIDEEHPCDPDDSYGLSKLLGEQACARWSRAHELSTIALRINSTWYVDRAGAERVLGGGSWTRDLTLDELWSRYRLQLEQPERERSVGLGPPPTRRSPVGLHGRTGRGAGVPTGGRGRDDRARRRSTSTASTHAPSRRHAPSSLGTWPESRSGHR